MEKIFLCVLVFWGTLFADVRIPDPWNPGWFEFLGKNPARKASGFKLGILWTEPMEGVDYDVVGIVSEWGNSHYRLGASFAGSFLDSLYRSENFGMDFSISAFTLLFGAGGNVDIQMIPGEATWWRAVGQAGISWNGSAMFSGGLWGIFPSDFERPSLAGNIFWNPGENFWSEVAFLYQRPHGFLLAFGEKIRLGTLELQGSVAYPGPRVGIGVSVRIRSLGASFGMHRDGNYMNSRMCGLFYRKNSEIYELNGKF